MKYIITLFLAVFLFCADTIAQEYIFHYNPYSGYNTDQLELALKQSKTMKRNGMIATAVGTGMLVGGSLVMIDGLYPLYEADMDPTRFGVGLGLMCVSGFPLGYGLVAWMMGSEQVKQIEIELLADGHSNLRLKPTGNGLSLVYNF